jgi:hypothetical protein
MQKLPKLEKRRRDNRRVFILGRRRRVVILMPPAAPQNLGIEETPTYLRLFWDDASNNEEGFRLYRRAFGDPFELTAEVLADQTEFYDGNVEMGVIYTYYLVAFNSAGESSASNEVSGELQIGE